MAGNCVNQKGTGLPYASSTFLKPPLSDEGAAVKGTFSTITLSFPLWSFYLVWIEF